MDGAGPEVRLGMRAVDGAAAPPEAARRLAGVVGPVRRRCRRSRQRQECAGLGHGVAERHVAHAVTDEVEEIAMGSLGGVGPLAGNAGGREADEERAPAGAANVAGGPVPALPAPVGQVGAADLFGALAEGLCDPGGVHAAPPLRPESARVPAGLGLSAARGRRGGAQRTCAPPGRTGLCSCCTEKGARARAGNRRGRGPQGAGGRRRGCQATTSCCVRQAGCNIGMAGARSRSTSSSATVARTARASSTATGPAASS